jgi:iron complex transport system substrate-binding protein
MRLFKNFLMLVFCFLLMPLFASCGKENTAKENAVVATGGYSVTDVTGTKLNFVEKPKRIISMSAGVDEILLDMLNPQRIIAVTYLADNPTISSVSAKAKAIPGRVKGNSAEEIITMSPDLVIMPDWAGLSTVNTLRDMGITVYVYKTPASLGEIQDSINNIAVLVGEKETGIKMVEKMQAQLDKTWSMVNKIPENKRRCIVALSQMGAFGAKGTTFDDLCKHANIINGVALTGITKNESLSKEQIVAINPDVLLLPSWDATGKGELSTYADEVKNDPAYMNIKAVRNDRLIHVHDNYLYSISQYAANAVDELARGVYPELYN